MDCDDVMLALARRAGHSLSETDESGLLHHLDGCTSCRLLASQPDLETDPTLPSAAADDRPLRGKAIGRFVVLDVLGSGGMGVVYKAYDPDLDRKVALKLLRRRARESEDGDARLLREAQAMARIKHRNVIVVHEVGTFEQQVYVAMEYVDGGTLRSWLHAGERSRRQIMTVFLQAGQGLAAAHAAGLVHRDFKPDNVLISADGSVLVTDFGLVGTLPDQVSEPPDHLPEATPSRVTPLSQDLTRTGAIIGTPAYMAPEQFDATGIATARTDQFAFCVALYEALYGHRPFPGSSLLELAGTVARGQVVAEPRSSVPIWLRRILLRGLAVDPDSRFPSMTELLAALARDPARRRRHVAIAASAVTFATVAVAFGATQMRSEPSPCEGGDLRLTGIWDAAAKQRVRAGLIASGRTHAAETWKRVDAELDRYAADAVDRRREVCEATEIRHEQSAGAFDLRMQCIGERLDSLRALVNLLAVPDPNTADLALAAARSLPSPDECKTRVVGESPPSPLQRAPVAVLDREMAEARVLADAGKYRDATRRFAELRGRAHAIGYAPAEAEILVWLATAQSGAGDAGTAEKTLHDALALAARGRDDQLIARADTLLMWVVGHQLGRPRDALALEPLAAAAIQRANVGPDVESQLRYHVGAAHVAAGAFQAAADAFEQALAIREKAFGKEHPTIFELLTSLGAAQLKTGNVFGAKAMLDRAVALGEKVLGPTHPAMGNVLGNLGALAQAFGDYDQATAYQKRALAILEEVDGPDHQDVGMVLYGLAVSANGREDYRGALPHYQRALAIYEKLGPEHPQVGLALVGIADCLEEIGRAPEAVAPGERALAIVTKTTSDPVQLAMAQFILAKALWSAGREHARARILAAEARKGFIAGGLAALAGTQAVDKWFAKTTGQP